MNSLEDLNDFSDEPVDYNDQANFAISVTPLGNQVVTISEEQSHQVPVGITVNSITSGPPTIYYEINLTNAGGNATLIWPTVANVTFSNPSTNVYRATNVGSISKWNAIKQPTVFLSRDYANNFSYTASLNAGTGNVFTWSVAVNITDTPELSPLPPPAVTYDEDVIFNFTSANVFQIVDTATSGSYTLTGTLSNVAAGNLSSTTGNTSFSSGVLTITGTKSVVNTTLNGLRFTPAQDFASNFVINWLLTNPVSGFQTATTQTVNIGETNEEIINMGFNRSYSTNGFALLFPANVPVIEENVPGAIYTIQLETVSDIGEIHLGTNFASPAGWSSIDHTYTFTGTKAQCNTIFQTLRFFPYINVSSNTQVIYRQSRNGTLTAVQQFTLSGTARNYIDGPNSQTLAEDSTYTDSVVVAPHWSQSYAVIYRTERPAGTIQSDIATLTVPAGWSSDTGRIYRNFSAVNDVTTMATQVASAQSLQFALKPDYATAWSLYRAIGIGSTTSNGTSFTGGTVYTDPMAVTITNSPEYTVPASLTYEEDNNLTFSGFAVSDAATGKNYTVSTILDSIAIGNLWFGNINYSGNVTLSGDKTTLTSQLNTIQFRPVANGSASGTIYYSQTQTTDNIVQASNVVIPLNSTGDIPEPVINGWALSSVGNDNRRSGFALQQTITGAANAAIVAASTTYSIGLVPGVNSQPVIQSAVKTQSGNDAILTLNGYWDNVQNDNPFTNPTSYTTSFPVTTTAVNTKNQVASGSFPVFTYTDYLENTYFPVNGVSGVVSGSLHYYRSVYLITHYSSGLIDPFKTWCYISSGVPIAALRKVFLASYNTSITYSPSNVISDPTADIPATAGTVAKLYNSQDVTPTYVTTPSYNVAAPITPTSPANVTPQPRTQYLTVYVAYESTLLPVPGNPPVFQMRLRKQLANNLVSEAGLYIARF